MYNTKVDRLMQPPSGQWFSLRQRGVPARKNREGEPSRRTLNVKRTGTYIIRSAAVSSCLYRAAGTWGALVAHFGGMPRRGMYSGYKKGNIFYILEACLSGFFGLRETNVGMIRWHALAGCSGREESAVTYSGGVPGTGYLVCFSEVFGL